jgi:hypothetical protein
MMKKEYVKFCFVSNTQKFYTNVLRKENLKDSYKNAKKNIIRTILKKIGRYNITDVSFRLKGCGWSKISWDI